MTKNIFIRARAAWPRGWLRVGVVLLGLTAFAACGPQSTQASLASARESLARGDHGEAIIRLKSILQTDEHDAQARELLGEALLASGDPRGAFIELEKGAQMQARTGASNDRISLLLARAELGQGKFQDVVRRTQGLQLKTLDVQAQLMAVRAWALYRLGQTQSAVTLIEETAAQAPREPAVRLVQARILAVHGQVDKALESVRSALALAPGNPEGWQLQAEILWLGKHDRAAALASYQKAIELEPRSVAAHSGQVRLALEARDAAGAARALEAMRQVLPRHPQTRYLMGMDAYLRQDLVAARREAQALLKEAPDAPRVLLLAGMIESQAGAARQAQNLLTKAMQLEPRNPIVRRELAAAFVRSGEPERAQLILRDQIDASTRDPALLALAAQTRLLLGDANAAQDLFARALALAPDDLRLRTALLLTQTPDVGVQRTLDGLEKLAATDQGTYADWALTSLAVARGELPRALAALDRIAVKEPKAPLVHAYRAKLELRLGQVGAARTSLERALALDAGFAPAIVGLAQIDVVQGKPQDGRRRLEAAVAAQPGSYPLLLALAQSHANDKADPGPYRDLLRRAIAANPADVQARTQMVASLVEAGATDEALALIREAVAAQPEQPELQEMLGRLQIRKGQFESGVTTLTRLANARPADPGLQMALAEGLAQAGRLAESERVLQRTVETTPTYVPALRALTDLAVRKRDFGAAMASAREVQRRLPQRSVGYAMQGDLLALQRKWPGADAAYREAQRVEPGTEVAAKLVATAFATAGAAEAARRIEQWSRAHPRDERFLMLVADQLLARNDLAGAESHYRKALALRPENPVALNNLALALERQGKPGALALAERAYKLLSDNAAVMDTLATLKSRSGAHEEALTLQRRAVQLEPSNAALRLGLGRILLASGDKAGAREELDRVLKSTAAPAQKDEARQLLQQAG